MKRPPTTASPRSEFADALRKGLLIGVAALAVVLPPTMSVAPAADRPQVVARAGSPQPQPLQSTRSKAPARVALARETSPSAKAAPEVIGPEVHPRAARSPDAAPAKAPPERLADFAGKKPSPDVRQMAQWVVQSGDHGRMAFVIIDKKDAKVYAFNPAGRLQSAVPALLGSARGDHTVPGIGDKPIAQVRPEERTTPAGRFVAELGTSSSRGEDVVWVDYDAAVSMHRVLKVPARLRALSSPTKEDNRMSYGCINLPDTFFEKVLRPLVKASGAVVYVLPETRPLQEVFASFHDVSAPAKLAHY